MSRSTAKRGAVVKTAAGKTRITIRLDNAVPTWFRDQAYAAGGGSYRCVPKIVSGKRRRLDARGTSCRLGWPLPPLRPAPSAPPIESALVRPIEWQG